jgi:Tol biopolymer transport system component
MKTRFNWRKHSYCLLLLLAFSLQSCLGLGGNAPKGNFGHTTDTGNGEQLGVNDRAVFQGKLYFTINRTLWVLDGTRTPHRLTRSNMAVRDPAVSPDHKWIAFVIRYKDYADLAYMPITGGKPRILRTGQGKYYYVSTFIHSSYTWQSQPAWSADSTHLLFLSDFEKEDWYTYTPNAPLLDLQVFSIPFNDPSQVQDVAYAYFGDGGDRDPSYRPGHPDQVVYTHYAYDSTQTQQVIQIFLENANAIASHPKGYYHPGEPGFDPGVAITPPQDQNIQPAFSPDGNSLAYVRREGPDQMGLYVMPVPNAVTDDPNSSAIAKKALGPYKQSSLILTGEFVSQPVWSPDGKQIAYLSYTNETFDIWLVNVAPDPKTGLYHMQGSPVQLTDGGVDADSRPCWTT